jgi:hypothetical protein
LVRNLASATRIFACPSCHEKISYLGSWSSAHIRQVFIVEATGRVDYSDDEVHFDGLGDDEYFCPECDYTFTTNEQEAARLLYEWSQAWVEELLSFFGVEDADGQLPRHEDARE